jgi:hypothetical protein
VGRGSDLQYSPDVFSGISSSLPPHLPLLRRDWNLNTPSLPTLLHELEFRLVPSSSLHPVATAINYTSLPSYIKSFIPPTSTMSTPAPTSRTREAPQGDEEAAAELKLGEFQDVDALTHSEAALVINALVSKRRQDRKNMNETEYVSLYI